MLTRLQYEDQIVHLKKQLSEKTLGVLDKEVELEISNSYLDKTTAEFIALKNQFRTLKHSHLKLEIELEKEKELVLFYKQSATSSIPKSSARRNKLDRVKTSKTFICTTEGVLAKIVTDYTFRNGLDGLVKFIKPMIKDGKNRCYVRTDPTRLHYNKFDGITWEHDRNGLFIREVLDIMKPHVKKCYDDLGNETITCGQHEKDKTSSDFYALTPLSQGIIHSNGTERNVLIGEIAAKLAHVTDI